MSATRFGFPGNVLGSPVHRFVSEISEAVARISAAPAERDVALEAFNLSASFVDADGRHTDTELVELAVAFVPWLNQLSGATPAHLRNSGLVVGTRPWKEKLPPLFEVLVAADRRDGTRASWRYYELAMHLAHSVCGLDAYTSREELEDLDRFRTLLLEAMRAAGVGPPTGPSASPSAPARPAVPPTGPGLLHPKLPTPAQAVEAGPPPVAAEPVEALLAELDDLVGLKNVKEEVHLVTCLLQVQELRRRRGFPIVETSRHLVFTGNPGTGKTTVARLLARIYKSLGVVERGHLIETDRSGLVAGYVGQTALNVKAVVESALDGLLLIDEAYALARGREGDFGREAIDTLVKLIEDHRYDLVVIAAGYPEEMSEFIGANPGLRSRFPKTIHFDDYSDAELMQILDKMCDDGRYQLTAAARRKAQAWFAAQPRDKGFGNARLARNLFEAALARQAQRLVRRPEPSDREIEALRPADIPDVPGAPTA